MDVPTATTEIIAATFIDAKSDDTEAIVASCVAKLTLANANEICKNVNNGPNPVKIVGIAAMNL